MEDLIKREDAIKAISISCGTCLARDTEDCDKCSVPKLCGLISAIPSADRPQGEWIEQEDDYHHYWECSECGMGVGLDDIRNYCPHCGAQMKGADDE